MKNPVYQTLSDQQLAEIDELCDRFDRELVAGNKPGIELYLEDAPGVARLELLSELLAMEIEYRRQQGENPEPSDYSSRFPQQEQIIDREFPSDRARRRDQKTDAEDSSTPELDDYRLLKELGRGGMGVVWLAEQIRPVRRQVALKLIKSRLPTEQVIARFDIEKQALAMMDHQNIARVLDAGTTQDGRSFFAMEVVNGIPITQYCDETRLSVDERLALFVCVCKAVQHAHQKGVVHRDLKPSNILVCNIVGEPVPKIIDFGLAKAVHRDLRLSDATMETECGNVLGTVQYMSPEQAELQFSDGEDIDTRTDIYSLGVILYELLTGSTPLDQETMRQNALIRVLEMIREQDPPRPSNRLSSVSQAVSRSVSDLRRLQASRLRNLLQGELDWVAMKALEKDRNRRYPTAYDLAQDISNCRSGAAVAARPPSAFYQFQKFSLRHRGLVAALFAISASLIAGIVGTSYGLIRANEKTELAEARAAEALEQRGEAVRAKALAKAESERARDAEVSATFQLAVSRFSENRAEEARSLLHLIPHEYRDTFEWRQCKRRFQGSHLTCYGHTDEVLEVEFTPDGQRLISAGKDGTIRFWDAVTGHKLSTIEGDGVPVLGLSVTSDGRYLASGNGNGVLNLWNLESGEFIRSLSGHQGAINCVAVSQDGRRIASASSDKTIKLWEFETGEELVSLAGHRGAVLGVAFSPNGEQLVSTSIEDETVRVWDVETGAATETLRPGPFDIRRLAFSPDGSYLAAATLNRAWTWSTQNWELVSEIAGPSRRLRSVAFSPSGALLAIAGESKNIEILDARTKRQTATLTGHAGTIWALRFSPDGSRIASASADGTIKVWSTQAGNELRLRGHARHVYSVAFSEDGKHFASGGQDGAVLLREALATDVKYRLEGHSASIADIAFSPDGTRLVSAADDNTIRVWDTSSGKQVAVLQGHTAALRAVQYSPDGARLVSSSYDGTIRIWDAQSYETNATIIAKQGAVYDVAFSADGALIVSAGRDNKVKLWNALSGREVRSFVGHTGRIKTLAFDVNSEQLVSGGYDKYARLWDVKSGEQISRMLSASGGVSGIDFSPDGNRVAASGGNVFQVFNTAGTEILSFRAPGNIGFSQVAFNGDGTKLAAALAGPGSPVHVWDAPRDHETEIWSGHTGTVTSVSFSQDGTRIYSASDGERIVWSVALDQERVVATQDSSAAWEPPEEAITHTPDGRWFLTHEQNNLVLVDQNFKDSPQEKAYRNAKSRFDPFWHEAQASAAAANEDWYAAVFHHAWIVKNAPESKTHRLALKSALEKLDETEIEASAFFSPDLLGVLESLESRPLPRPDNPSDSQ